MSVAKTTLEPIDLSKLLARHANCWVALSADERRVIAHGKDPKVALIQSQKLTQLGRLLNFLPLSFPNSRQVKPQRWRQTHEY